MRRRPADPIADFETLFTLREDGFRDHVARVFGPRVDADQRGYLVSDLAECQSR